LDITERKKADEALWDSEKKYRTLLNGMNYTAWVIDFDGNIIDVNDAAVEVLGYSREEFRSIGLTGIDSNLDPEEIKGLVEGMPADEIQVFETAHTTKRWKDDSSGDIIQSCDLPRKTYDFEYCKEHHRTETGREEVEAVGGEV